MRATQNGAVTRVAKMNSAGPKCSMLCGDPHLGPNFSRRFFSGLFVFYFYIVGSDPVWIARTGLDATAAVKQSNEPSVVRYA